MRSKNKQIISGSKPFYAIGWVLATVAALSLSACGGSSNDMGNKPALASAPPLVSIEGIKVNNGILVFENQARFDETTRQLGITSDENKLKWERQFEGFTSMQTDFAHVNNSLSDFSDSLDHNMNQAEALQRIANYRAGLLQSYKTSVIERKRQDGSMSIEINAVSQSMGPVLNQQGMVQVGDKLIQYTHDTIKTGSASMQANDLFLAKKSDPLKQVFVSKVVRQEMPSKVTFINSGLNHTNDGYAGPPGNLVESSGGEISYGVYQQQTGSNKNDVKIIVYNSYFFQNSIDGDPNAPRKHWVEIVVKSEVKNRWGNLVPTNAWNYLEGHYKFGMPTMTTLPPTIPINSIYCPGCTALAWRSPDRFTQTSNAQSWLYYAGDYYAQVHANKNIDLGRSW